MHWHYVHKIVEFDEIAQADELSFFVLDYFEMFTTKQFCYGMYRKLWQFSIHQNDPTLRCIPAKRDHVNNP